MADNPCAVNDPSSREDESRRLRLLVVVINYRTPELTLRCLEHLESGVAPYADRRVVVVDNDSGDGSEAALDEGIRRRGWSRWVDLVCCAVNGGFSAGNNAGLRYCDSEAYLFINSDAFVEPGAVDTLLGALEQRPDAGLVGPRLLHADGSLHHSCYRFMTPLSELTRAARTAPLTALFRRRVVVLPHPEEPSEPEWTSFACVLIRREVVETVGLLDEGYFLYFEDQDYCRRARDRGWTVLNWPDARVVHLAGKSGDTRQRARELRRRPDYFYRSRARYFTKSFGQAGLVCANLLWMAGRSVSLIRELVGRKERHLCEREGRDIWIGWRDRVTTVPESPSITVTGPDGEKSTGSPPAAREGAQ